MDMIIRRTEDHSIFKHLVGNRGVTDIRVEKIKDSIKKVGYITNPIIVNENYQIIDGQGREQALDELGLPVDFIVVEGIGIDECRAMNIHQSNWTIEDYVWSYAEQGIPSYLRLRRLMEKYKKFGFGYKAITCIIRKGVSELAPRFVIDGELLLDEESYRETKECIEWMKDILPILEDTDCGSIKAYIQVLAWCYFNPDIDKTKLCTTMRKRSKQLTPVSNSEQAASVIEAIYDFHCPDKSYLSHEYRKDRNREARAKRKMQVGRKEQ